MLDEHTIDELLVSTNTPYEFAYAILARAQVDSQAPVAWFVSNELDSWAVFDAHAAKNCKQDGCNVTPLYPQLTIAPSVAHRGGDAPKGWKLVPLVPTDVMVREGSDNNSTCWDGTTDNGFPDEVSRAVYTAMISVAPESTDDVAAGEEYDIAIADAVAEELWLCWNASSAQSWEKVVNKEKYLYPARKAIETLLGWKPKSAWEIARSKSPQAVVAQPVIHDAISTLREEGKGQ